MAAQLPVARDNGVADSGQGKVLGKEVDRVRLADSAKCEVYVCFVSTPQARNAGINWRGEYVEIFSLLPLEK